MEHSSIRPSRHYEYHHIQTRALAIADTPARRFMSVEMLTDVWITQQIASAGARFAQALSFSRYLIHVTPTARSKAHSHR